MPCFQTAAVSHRVHGTVREDTWSCGFGVRTHEQCVPRTRESSRPGVELVSALGRHGSGEDTCFRTPGVAFSLMSQRIHPSVPKVPTKLRPKQGQVGCDPKRKLSACHSVSGIVLQFLERASPSSGRPQEGASHSPEPPGVPPPTCHPGTWGCTRCWLGLSWEERQPRRKLCRPVCFRYVMWKLLPQSP